MVNFADCVSKVQCRSLVTNTPTKDGIRALLKATTSVNKTSQNGFKLGGLPTVVQDSVMLSMGAKYKGKKTCLLNVFTKPFKQGGLSTITEDLPKFEQPIKAKSEIVLMNGFVPNKSITLNESTGVFKSRFKPMSDEKFFESIKDIKVIREKG